MVHWWLIAVCFQPAVRVFLHHSFSLLRYNTNVHERIPCGWSLFIWHVSLVRISVVRLIEGKVEVWAKIRLILAIRRMLLLEVLAKTVGTLYRLHIQCDMFNFMVVPKIYSCLILFVAHLLNTSRRTTNTVSNWNHMSIALIYWFFPRHKVVSMNFSLDYAILLTFWYFKEVLLYFWLQSMGIPVNDSCKLKQEHLHHKILLAYSGFSFLTNVKSIIYYPYIWQYLNKLLEREAWYLLVEALPGPCHSQLTCCVRNIPHF